MLNIKHLLISSVLLLLVSAKTTKLPSFLHICHRSDPHLNDCIKKSVEKLRPLLSKGIPEFGIPSCEPLRIPEVVIDQGAGPVSVKSIYKDIKVYGPSDFTLKHVKIDLDKNRVRIKVWIPRLELISDYTMDGKILMMPIQGSGTSHGNYTNIDATIIMQGQQIKKDGDVYFNVKDFYVDFNIGHASIQLDNLFNGDKELGEAMNLFLNDNWRQVSNEIKPVLEDTIASIFKKFSNKIYHKYPLEILLPK
ncbi:PREDICTED: protein takeout-like [Nicrophorus vespilloides]|uniref:Protein takeout-like n=1 Tax=Nicrophorus vespilloides TaxID=110193 RepID=A0ABM1N2D6_NICVS|nr:PREDICTED: protein takeout-like [Nicrophorus vespilloides]